MASKKIIPNDNISKSLKNIIGALPASIRDSEQYLDVISWNLRWFNHQEKDRVKNITEILRYLNADIFIFQEVQDGSLDEVAAQLRAFGSGYYQVHYGRTGGDQRVAIMYDTEWVRAKDEIVELFGKGAVKTGDNKDAFPRLPFYGYFLAKSPNPDESGFTFQLVGVHLKSQVGGGNTQRIIAAEKLAWWLEKEANDVDADTIIIGDWNKGPSDTDWQAIHKLENEKKVLFRKINDESDFSHLYYKNKNEIGSRLDIALVTSEAYAKMASDKTSVGRWVTIEQLLQSAPAKKVSEIKAVLNSIKENISDHMPLYAGYYLVDDEGAAAKPRKKRTN